MVIDLSLTDKSKSCNSNSLASALGNADSRYQGAYTDRGDVLEAGVPLPVSVREADGLSGGLGAKPPGYKEYVDTSSLKGKPWPECAKWVLPGECPNGHRWAKVLLCGFEWCSTCGAEWSWIHQRRFSRWLPKAMQMRAIGYFVIEWPLASRSELHSKRALSSMGRRVKAAMQVLGFERGLRRWHFFGEAGVTFNPHINVLVDGRYIPDGKLEGIKSFLRTVLGEPELIVNYHYRKSPGEMVHTLKYVLRATFLDKSWDTELAEDLYRFQNTNYWGRWPDAPAWDCEGKAEFEAIEKLEAGICPECGEAIDWGRAADIRWLSAWGATDVGGGYYRLADTGPPPAGLPADVKERLYWLEQDKEAKLQVAAEYAKRIAP